MQHESLGVSEYGRVYPDHAKNICRYQVQDVVSVSAKMVISKNSKKEMIRFLLHMYVPIIQEIVEEKYGR
jgi:hypothetical protein